MLLRRLTPELGREEVRVWKQAIRMINHELKNSLAPISSLLHSARVVTSDPERREPARREKLDAIFAGIEDRVAHLTAFLDGYARYARLPAPQRRETPWSEILEAVRPLYPFVLEGEPRPATAAVDPAQIEQLLINLLKNAHEASGDEPDVTVRILPAEGVATGGSRLEVRDRGRGLEPDVLERALLPFYSTKPDGVGVGLPLAREIVVGHGGRLQIGAREGGGTVVSCWFPPSVAGPVDPSKPRR